MIIQLAKNITEVQRDCIVAAIDKLGYKTTHVNTQRGSYLVSIGKKEFDLRTLGSLPGISDIHRVSDELGKPNLIDTPTLVIRRSNFGQRSLS